MDEPTPRRSGRSAPRPAPRPTEQPARAGGANSRTRSSTGSTTRTAAPARPVAGRNGARPPARRAKAATQQFQPAIITTRPLSGATRPHDVAGGLAGARFAGIAPLLVVVIGVVLLITVNAALGAVLILVGLVVGITNLVIGSPTRLAARMTTHPVDGEHEARLVNLTEMLCIGLGVPFPTLRILDDDAPNAVTIGRNAASSILICTTGLLALLDRMELEGVIAHELAHAKRGDLDRAAATTTALGAFALVSASSAGYVRRLAGPESESLADLRGVGITRYPPGLAMALEKIAASPRVVPAGLDKVTTRLTGPLWCAPFGEVHSDEVRAGVLDVGQRAAALREL